MHDLSPAAWQPLLTTRRLGRTGVILQHTLTSTNTVLKDAARTGALAEAVALCEQQTAGRGRLDRTWSSPEGQGVWMSVLLRPQLPPEKTPMITFCAALAMTKAVRSLTGLDARIKWPNDVVLSGHKVCGVLLEAGFTPEGQMFVVIGSGLNIRRGAYPPELTERAVSLEELCPPPGREALIAAYLNGLEAAVDAVTSGGFTAIEEEYRALSCTLGREVQVLSPAETFTGTALSVDETGALLVRTEDGATRRVLAGDVSVRGVMGYV
ncbi:MAG: biotin--[Clostridia bacterium]|nr:biotin--[acetyl-CoA-carboxylase] ligase [Clostridia bacterium]